MNEYEHCLIHVNDLLQDVFANLLGNAIKHTEDRADIVLDLYVLIENGDRFCRVIVEDNVPGIADDFKGTVFNRLLKSTDNAKGVGLWACTSSNHS